MPDSVVGTRLVDKVAAGHPTIRKAWVDGGYRRHLVEHAVGLGIDTEIVQRPPATKGFTPPAEVVGGGADAGLG